MYKNIQHIYLHILFIIYFMTSSKIRKIIKIQQVHQKLQRTQLLLFYLNCFPFEFKVTQEMRLI